MRIIFTTDLHGNEQRYNGLFEVAKVFKADIVINGGDMLPKDIELFRQGEFITGYLDNHFAQFNSAGIYYLCYLGNDDLRIFDQLFDEICKKYDFVVSLAQRKFDIENYEFIGMNWVVDYPFRLKDRCRMDTADYKFQKQLGKGILSTPDGWQEIDDWFAYANTLPTIEKELEKLVKPNDMKNAIYIIHMPPSGVGLDKCSSGIAIGSKAIHDFLLKNQPLLSLHGHIHESPDITGSWRASIGNTICIQPGQLDDLTFIVIDLPAMNIERKVQKL